MSATTTAHAAVPSAHAAVPSAHAAVPSDHAAVPSLLDRALRLDPQVALRPEPFGALAYHYGNRRLVFLKDPDMVAVARRLGEHESLAATLQACAVDERRWPSFATAFRSLIDSHVVTERDDVDEFDEGLAR